MFCGIWVCGCFVGLVVVFGCVGVFGVLLCGVVIRNGFVGFGLLIGDLVRKNMFVVLRLVNFSKDSVIMIWCF